MQFAILLELLVQKIKSKPFEQTDSKIHQHYTYKTAQIAAFA